MKHSDSNPAANSLPAGVSAEAVLEAVEKSGYPLQSVVADTLGPKFDIQHEWSFVDRSTQDLRSLDLLCTMGLPERPSARIRPKLNLLIECKQSELPYVFFLARENSTAFTFPYLAGLHHYEIEITSDDTASTWHLPIEFAIGMTEDKFRSHPPLCYTLSKCVRKGKEIELSGSDAYNSLTMPIVKALQHFRQAKSPKETFYYFDLHLAFGIGLLDAPMVGIAGRDAKMIPWVRLCRHEPSEQFTFGRGIFWVFDIVHRHYLYEYVFSHLVPYAERFAEAALMHPNEIADGKAFAPGMEKHWHKNLEQRLQPRRPIHTAVRSRSILKNIMDLMKKGRSAG